MNNKDRFLNLFIELEKILTDTIWDNNYIWYKDKLKIIKDGKYKLTWCIKCYYSELTEIWYFRNDSLHRYNAFIWDISDNVINKISKIISKLNNPETCYDAFKKEIIFCCKEDDDLSFIIKLMKKNLYTHIPVYSNDNKFKWIITESTITYFLWENIDNEWNIILGKIKIKNLNLGNWNDYYEFIDRNTTIYDLENKFLNAINWWKRLWALFITNLWKEDEKIDWIITAWDIPKVKTLF
jgi:hypothetical protein